MLVKNYCSYLVYYTKLMLVKDLLLISCILYQINANVKDLLLISCILYQINACQRFIAHILYIIPN